MNIIIFGGTFDPPHLGHYQIIKKCVTLCDELIIIPNRHSPLKNKMPSTSINDRLAMLKLLINDIEGNVVINDFEINANETPSYTINTIQHIINKYDNNNLFLVLGSDQYADFNKWKSYRKIKNLVKIICINRPNYNTSDVSECIYIDDINCSISSSYVRLQVGKNISSINRLVPIQISNYIKEKKLYC